MNPIIEDAFTDLFPKKDPTLFDLSLSYSEKFKPYNGNVRRRGNSISFNFSAKWKTISREIQIGLAQELFCKLFKVKLRTSNIDMYHHFIKSIHIAAPKTEFDPLLAESFDRNNTMFFSDMMEMPNLKWGSETTGRLGLYEYGSDTITISSILKDANLSLLDYVMYHEMLHKKLKFTCSNGRTYHHPPEFKRLEAKFPNSEILERELSRHASRKRGLKRLFSW